MEWMRLNEYAKGQVEICQKHDAIEPALYKEYGVKKGLRDEKAAGPVKTT
jgi:hypothetical protein